jgi:predicted nucleic acid-binding protein
LKAAYLDACAIIYLVEATPSLQERVRARLAAFRASGLELLTTSSLSRLECRVRPLREKDVNLLTRYDGFFTSDHLLVASIGDAVIERATEIRARYGFKTPDAIHLATAITEQAEVFVTGDTDLARCKDIPVEIIAE